MPKIKIADMDMVYRIEGRGDPVVLIHGLGGDHTSFDDPLRPALLERFRVLTMDLRGHGRSSRTRREYTTGLFADDVRRLLGKLKISNARVLGTSMGGAVAMILAARYPALVRRLVLVDTWARCDEAARACFLEWAEAAGESCDVLQRIVLIRTATAEFVAANPDFIAFFRKFWPTNFGRAFRKSCLACADHDARSLLPKIAAPTLVLAGERDILVPPVLARDLAQSIRGSTLKIIPAGGHVPWLDNPRDTLKEIETFLAEE